jgi:spore germination protein
MRLLHQNIIQPNYDLVVGQNLVITNPDDVYYVQNGDTLQSIADAYGVSEVQLMQNNPQLSGRNYLYIGEEIIINYIKDNEAIEVNGYAFSYINVETLRKTLPLLTYITILGYQMTATGDITVPNDTLAIEIAREYGVVPLMMCSTINVQGVGEYETSHILFTDKSIQENYINNIIQVLKDHNLSGINFGCQFVLKEDLQNYINLMAEVKLRLQKEGYLVFITLIPSTFGFVPDSDNDSTYFYQIGQIADRVILISYQWACSNIPLVEQTTVKFLDKYVQYAITQIPSNKILLGITRVGYDWKAPYTDTNCNATLLTNTSALDSAYNLGVDILFDEETQTPYFYYTSGGIEHFVWFKDAKTIISILDLINKYHLRGISVWSIMDFGPATWTVINSQKKIEKY